MYYKSPYTVIMHFWHWIFKFKHYCYHNYITTTTTTTTTVVITITTKINRNDNYFISQLMKELLRRATELSNDKIYPVHL
jgi:hypothetical protein